MDITVDLHDAGPHTELVDPTDFTRFRVLVLAPAGRTTGLTEALKGLGRIDTGSGSHAFITPHGLRSLAGDLADDPRWNASLDGMIAYASSQGWTATDGAIRAHIAWADPANTVGLGQPDEI